MRKAKVVVVLLTVIILIGIGCNPGPAGTPQGPVSRATVAGAQVPGAPRWQDEWQKVIAEARKEGTLIVSISGSGPELRTALSKGFQDKFGIEIEFITGRANELGAKVLSERRSGLYVQDILIMGTSTPIPVLKPEGALDPIDKQLILPEVLDKNVWWEGDLAWLEPERLQLVFIASVIEPLVINTSLVGPGEIKSFRDVLNPKWKGKIVMDDPSVSGTGQAFIGAADDFMGTDYLRQLAKQEPAIIRDARLATESLARGKYAILGGASLDQVTNFKRSGAPIESIIPAEGGILTASLGGLSLLNRAPHPAAARLFLNWILTREALTIFSKVHGSHTTRSDVPTEFLDPIRVREPGKKYFKSYTLEFAMQRPKYSQLAREIFGIK
ncbi:MAG: extracellular solute-binding protein [Chloroflexi bacterium]|nr:extracellular solute-binding protein [Chloroflexota bacterium]